MTSTSMSTIWSRPPSTDCPSSPQAHSFARSRVKQVSVLVRDRVLKFRSLFLWSLGLLTGLLLLSHEQKRWFLSFHLNLTCPCWAVHGIHKTDLGAVVSSSGWSGALCLLGSNICSYCAAFRIQNHIFSWTDETIQHYYLCISLYLCCSVLTLFNFYIPVLFISSGIFSCALMVTFWLNSSSVLNVRWWVLFR